MELRVIEESDGLTHVALEGELDIPGVNAVGDKFYFHLTARRKPAIVDMAGVRFLSSLGIGMLVCVAQSLKRHGVSTPFGSSRQRLPLLGSLLVLGLQRVHG